MEEPNKEDSPGWHHTDLVDYDEVVLEYEDAHDLHHIHGLTDTTKDKLRYTVALTCAFVSVYLTTYAPQYVYRWFTPLLLIFVPYRWYVLRSMRMHYFLFNYCNFVNIAVLVYAWSPWKLGWMFPSLYASSCSILLLTIFTYRMSFVPHSVNKMTLLLTHTAPMAITYGIKWHSTEDQGCEICSDIQGSDGCDYVGWKELMLWPMVTYCVWMALYCWVTFSLLAQRIKQRGYITTYYFTTQTKGKRAFYILTNLFGPKYHKHMFIIGSSVMVFSQVVLGYPTFYSPTYASVLLFLMMLVATYNGATFYIDVIGKAYYAQQKNKSAL